MLSSLPSFSWFGFVKSSTSLLSRSNSSRPMSLEAAKKLAACAAVEEYVKSDFAVGIGSGSTVVYAVERLAELIGSKQVENIKCVPSSFQARQLIRKHNLRLTDLEETPVLDVAIDGADEVDSALTCIKGGGGCLTQEKIVVSAAKKFVVIADYSKQSERLGEKWKKGIPVEVIPMAYKLVAKKIEQLLGSEPSLRQAVAKAGPVVTDNGNFILDCPFAPGKLVDCYETNVGIKMIPGVVETGLFVGMAERAYFGLANGTVTSTGRPIA